MTGRFDSVLLCLSLLAIVGELAHPAHTQTTTVTRDCSPVISGSENYVKITCHGASDEQIASLNEKLVKLQAVNELNKASLDDLLSRLRTQPLADLDKVLSERMASKYDVQRLSHKIEGYSKLHFAAVVSLEVAEQSRYRALIAHYLEDSNLSSTYGLQASSLPSDARWFRRNDPFYPNKGREPELYNLLQNLTGNIHCFQAQQITSAMLGTIRSYRELESTWKSAPALAYQVSLSPFSGDRVRVTVAERNYRQYWMALTGFSLAPDRSSVQRIATLESSLDLLNGLCFVAVNFSLDATADTRKMTNFDMTSFTLVLNQTDQMSSNQNNWRKITDTPGLKIYRFQLPRTIDGLATIKCVGCAKEW